MDKNEYAGYYISQATAASKGRSYRIKHHDAMAVSGEGDLFMEDAVEEDFADDAALLIYNPFVVELTDAATEPIVGVATTGITADYYGFVQVHGYVPKVAVGHSTSAAIVLNEPLLPIAANPGSVQGFAGNTEADVIEAGILTRLFALQAVNANTTGFVGAWMR